MDVFYQLSDLPGDFRAGAVSIGNFDGVHRGHARLIEQLVRRAHEFSGPAVVFTFEPHPAKLLRPDRVPPPLTWLERKAELLARLGVDTLIAFPTSMDFLRLTPSEYFQHILCEQLRTKVVVEGPNFCFGRDRTGSTDTLRELCLQHEILCDIVTPILDKDQLVSSSRLRQAIATGDIDSANRLLTQPYGIRGLVTEGAGRGREIGFPTANLTNVDTLLPAPGVYAGRARLMSESVGAETRMAAINIGPNPTFGDEQFKIEVHLLDFDGSLYGEMLELDFLQRLRNTKRFTSREQLGRQLDLDIEQVRAM